MPSTQTQTRTKLFTGTGTNDNDVLIRTENVQQFNSFTLITTAGVADVFVSLDGTNFSSAALALEDRGATASTTYVVVTTAGRVFGFRGKYTVIRVDQNGGTAATAHLLCGQ